MYERTSEIRKLNKDLVGMLIISVVFNILSVIILAFLAGAGC